MAFDYHLNLATAASPDDALRAIQQTVGGDFADDGALELGDELWATARRVTSPISREAVRGAWARHTERHEADGAPPRCPHALRRLAPLARAARHRPDPCPVRASAYAAGPVRQPGPAAYDSHLLARRTRGFFLGPPAVSPAGTGRLR
jgi:hypothetical protein